MSTCDTRKPVVGIVPSYQPDEKLAMTVAGCLAACADLCRLIVVDDGSGCDYKKVFDALPGLGERVEVLHLGVNSGMGGAIKAGLQHALYAYPEASGFVTFDADGQHHPEDVANVIARFRSDESAFVIGCRNYHDTSLNIPLRSKFGNRVTEFVFRACSGVHLSDTQSGLRCYPRHVAELCTQIEKCRYEFQLEALLLSVERVKCVQVPIRTIYEDGNRRSHFRPVRDSLRIYSVFLRFVGSSLMCSALDYVIFAGAYLVFGRVFASLAVARVVSVLANFVFNKRAVFRAHGHVAYELAMFLFLAVMLFGMSYVGVMLLKDRFGMTPLLSKILVESVLFVCSFLFQRFCVFCRKDPRC